ncbi:UbiX family flavin prenyltransferase [Rhodobacter capsulatus]|uniref:UbiX family flavin prenyltransferase n=2 Tax=Rhodobacter capsulatus TaxID=1061 RepID=UPI0003D2F95D|nr:UbiX family flavin prenyltransferase [Rhodobacter capsulatus]ETD85600.1 3-octaprenyl-4-hydroxybenzoate carboxy-lyase [Rhodobacter capsulatus B6]ETD91830.1 3-octaprenyl-4-hydroxybenzoate carboxy-lyase [Rhodobacter capsulatus YW2]TQD32675.1 UbiX family flavin prenyltransferase [Rhodobacter capsulatus]
MSARVVLGVSGASGALLALAVAEALVKVGADIDLVVSSAAKLTFATEADMGALERLQGMAAHHHAIGNVGAAIASGSCPVAGMIVAPCSMRSLAAVAHGLDDNLLTRAASVQLKERRPLILLAREAPLTLAHLRNMTAVTEMGGIILPPVPAFYLKPQTAEEIATQIGARAVDLLRLGPAQAQAWSPSP